MDIQTYTTEQIIARYEELQRKVKEYESGIKSIRGKNWEIEIEKDERASIKTLYSAYKKAKYVLNTFAHTKFIEQEEEEEEGQKIW